jgi:hypothetical protein
MMKKFIINYLIGLCLLTSVSCSTPPIARVTADSITLVGGGSFGEDSTGEYHKYTAQNASGSVTLESGTQSKTQSTTTGKALGTWLGIEAVKGGVSVISDGLNSVDRAIAQ